MSGSTSSSSQLGTIEIPVTNAPEFRVIYSNILNYRVSLTDVTLIFSTLTDSAEPPRTFAQTQQVGVMMALGQVKNLAEYLNMIVARYEREIGPINTVGNEPPKVEELNSMFRVLKNIGVH